MRKYKYKFLLLISVMTVLLPITVNAEELTYGQVLDDLAKAQAELRAWAKELGLTPAARQRMKENGSTADSGIDPELDGMIAHD